MLLKNLYKLSFINVDFPEPETPVTHVINPIGILVSRSLRLFEEAPDIIIFLFVGGTRFTGTSIIFFPEMYIPVREFLFFSIFFGVPLAIISPPLEPAPGPISIT